MRIVSLVPSLTELVDYLGLSRDLVGRTRFCTEPPGIERVEAIGGTKDPDVARIVALAPALVIANREENRREDVEALRAAGLEVLVTDPNSVAEAVEMIAGLGARLGEPQRADALCAEIRETLACLEVPEPRPLVFAAVWRKPLLGMGRRTYGSDIVTRAGGHNVFDAFPESLPETGRYPELTHEQLAALSPHIILLPDEPFRFQQRHVSEFSSVAPAHVIDGRHLWWYGPRMPEALRELNRLFLDAASAG